MKKNIFYDVNMGKKIFFTGIVIFLLGIISYFFLPNIQNIFKNEKITVNTNHSEKIPQKIIPHQEKISAELSLDFLCEHCRNFYKTTVAPLKKQYEGEINFSIKMYPQLNEGLSFEMAKYFMCAKEQKEEFFLLDFFFFGKDEISFLDTETWNIELQLDTQKMTTCLETIQEKIITEKEKLKEKGVRGTPTLFLGEEKIEGGISQPALEMKIIRQIY